MKIIKQFFLIVIFISAELICQEIPDVSLPLIISDNAGNSKELNYGLDPLATDSIDTDLGEATLPPLPPAGSFDARFNLTMLTVTESTWKDYREGAINYDSITVHEIQYQVGSGGTTITIAWDMPGGVSGRLQDIILGTLIDVDMYDAGSYTVTNPAAFNKLKVTFMYDGTLPVELSSFTAALFDDYVRLNWTTANEIFNYGFEIEKRTTSSSWTKIGFVPGNGNSNCPKSYSFDDYDLTGSGIIQYRLKQIDNDGSFKYSNIVEVMLTCTKFYLSQNYPNPFNPVTTIKYSISALINGESDANSIKVRLVIYDVLGNEIETLVDEAKPPGTYKEIWNTHLLPSGLYVYILIAGDFISAKKMLLVK